MSFDAAKLAADTEAYCQELRESEELAYAQREPNHENVIGLAKPDKHNLLGMNIAEEFGVTRPTIYRHLERSASPARAR